MCHVDRDSIYRLLTYCGGDDLFFAEELRMRGIVSLLDHIKCNDVKYLDLVLWRRLSSKCRDMIREIFSHIYFENKKLIDEFINDIVNRVYSYIENNMKKIDGKQEYLIVTDDLISSGSTLRDLRLHLKKIIGRSIGLYKSPYLLYLLNIITLFPNEDYMGNLRDIFMDIGSKLIFLDQYDAFLFKKLGGKLDVSSLSDVLKMLLTNDNIYLEETYEMNVGIIRICQSILDDDLKNYLDILETMPNIHLIMSYKCIQSGYFNYAVKHFGNILFTMGIHDIFTENNPKIILSYDPYLYDYLIRYMRRKTYVIGFLPNLVIRFMGKIG